MKKHLIIFLIILSFIQEGNSQQYQKAINKARYLIKSHQEQTNIPAVQVAVLIDGEIVWSEAFGYSDLANGIKANKETQFRTASVAKPLTSLALAKLLEEGKIKLDTKAGDILPDLPEELRAITVRQLASSTSGIRHYNASDPTFRNESYASVEDALSIFINDPLEFKPGTAYSYSSYGWVLLSAMMEKASKRSFQTLMEETWAELDATHTNFDKAGQINENLSKQYILNKKDERVLAPEENRSFIYAGGGYISTAEDLVHIGYQLIEGEFLAPKTKDLLVNPIMLPDGENTYYGLGWEIGESRLNTPIWYHNGSMPTTRSHWIIYPEDKLVFAYMTNTGQHIFFNDREAQIISDLFLCAKRANDKVPSNLEAILGNYSGEIESLRGKSKKAQLKLTQQEDGIVTGVISFTRSKKADSYPIILISNNNSEYHFASPNPMFADFYLHLDENGSLTGTWQHDLVRKPNEEADDYWKKRPVKLIKE